MYYTSRCVKYPQLPQSQCSQQWSPTLLSGLVQSLCVHICNDQFPFFHVSHDMRNTTLQCVPSHTKLFFARIAACVENVFVNRCRMTEVMYCNLLRCVVGRHSPRSERVMKSFFVKPPFMSDDNNVECRRLFSVPTKVFFTD